MNDDTKENIEDAEFVPDEEAVSIETQKKLKKLKDDIAQCRGEKQEYLDGWQRAKAEFINYKKDEGKRMEEMGQFVRIRLVENFLPVLDSFDLALGEGIGKEVEQGIMLIRSQLEDILKKHGLEATVVMPGEAFDPERHESIGEAGSGFPPGVIAEVSQKGYMIRGRLIRPARVKLSSGLIQ